MTYETGRATDANPSSVHIHPDTPSGLLSIHPYRPGGHRDVAAFTV